MKKAVPKVLLWILGVAASLVFLAFLYLVLILAQPKDTDEAPPPQPLLTASPAVTADTEGDLTELVRSFPVPVMSFMSGSGMTFVSGASSDSAWNGGFGRTATLNWQTADGQPLILQSIYPADAYDLLGKRDYSFSQTAGPKLVGQSSVRMENETAIRIHVTTDTGLYAVTVPKGLGGRLSELVKSIQLFTVREEKEE